jgi:large subunit ribosomal protein L29
MANAKAAELRDLADDQLIERLVETKQELFNLRFQHVTGQLDNYARLQQLKRDIARVSTEMRAREIAAAEALEKKTDG